MPLWILRARLMRALECYGLGRHETFRNRLWRKPKFLEIRFAKARISQFSNFWQAQEVQNYSYVVELRLVPLDDNSSLSERDKN